MKRISLLTAVALAVLLGPVAARADKWVDHQPGKGVWQIQVVKVDPNKIDDYITGLTKSEIPALEILKKHGIIDDYFVMVKVNSGDYAHGNVMLGRHYTSFAAMSPSVQEAPAIIAEVKRVVSHQAADSASSGYDKYRSFDTDEVWMPIEFKAVRKDASAKAHEPKR